MHGLGNWGNEVEEFLIHCRNGHPRRLVRGFTRSSEAELLDRLAEDPEPSELASARARDKAGEWLVNSTSERTDEHVRGPRRLDKDGYSERPVVDGKVRLTCDRCGATVSPDRVRLTKLRAVLDDLWAVGKSDVSMQELRAVLEARKTRRRP